jgi:hypothetical protein
MPKRQPTHPEPVRTAAETYLAAWTLLVEALAAYRVEMPRPIASAMLRAQRWVRHLIEP